MRRVQHRRGPTIRLVRTRHAMPSRKLDPPRGVLRVPVEQPERFTHARYHPSSDLAEYLEHFWSVSWDLAPGAPSRVETLPHPTVHLIFETGKGGRIGGVSRGKFSTTLEGKGRIFAAKFRPGGFYPFVQRSVSHFSGRVLTIAEVWGSSASWIEAAILGTGDEDERHRLLEQFLRELKPVPDADATRTRQLAEGIATDRTLRSVEELARRAGMNLRALQRLFARYVGVNPKWVIQRYRLHEAAEQLARQPASMSALALELGYADQAHFIRDFKRIVGVSPALYARRAQAG